MPDRALKRDEHIKGASRRPKYLRVSFSVRSSPGRPAEFGEVRRARPVQLAAVSVTIPIRGTRKHS